MELKAAVVQCPGDFLSTQGYTCVRVLGHGMAGDVLLAQPREGNSAHEQQHLVAVKKFHRTTGEEQEAKNRQLFTSEASILQNICHENIIGNIQAFECPKEYAITMPYYKEGTLKHHLPTISRERAAKFLKQLASAVNYIHSRRLVHRDIKPANVLISDDGNDVILSDFGLACSVGPSGMTRQWHCGTRGYKAPELLKPSPLPVNAYKCDMYSVGVVVWNMVFQKERPPVSTDHLSYLRAQKHIPAFYKNLMENLLHRDSRARWNSRRLLSAVTDQQQPTPGSE